MNIETRNKPEKHSKELGSGILFVQTSMDISWWFIIEMIMMGGGEAPWLLSREILTESGCPNRNVNNMLRKTDIIVRKIDYLLSLALMARGPLITRLP
jgi:hypothetical protein